MNASKLIAFYALILSGVFAATQPAPPGKLVDLGGHRLHVNCTGKGKPTIVVENGLGDFSFDWMLVQSKVSTFSRICTYDRAGYAWSDPGPKPRTFAQINLELHDALAKLGEHGPFVLVGHSYGGPVVRNFAITFPKESAGMVLVDAAFEGERVGIGGGKTMRLGDDAKGRAIPAPREEMTKNDTPASLPKLPPELATTLDSMYKVLPADVQKLQLWAQSRPVMYEEESSQLEWSGEYFAKWMSTPQKGTLGAIPLIVLTRAEGGYGNDADVPAKQWEQERKDGQAKLVALSSNSKQVVVHSGHNMELEAPNDVTKAIREVVTAVRQKQKLQ
ncbi:MAG TPA: alpha/beta hydrolase [Terriglobales bacterium]|nr:alpha/beta hydrolase [Terriglobales bacterium]